MMAAAAALEGAGSPTKEEHNVPSAVQPRKGASTGTNSTLLHDSALCVATNTAAASTPTIPASVEASLHSLLSTPTGTKLAVTTPSDSPAGGEGARITLDEEKKIALSQLQELEVAIEVRKVTKVDGRKIRWIEYRARKKAEEEKQAALTKKRPRRSKAKSKGGENSENDANIVNNNNNNSKSENTMKVETGGTPLSVVGTTNVLESMKQQFLQGTENIEEPVANGKASLLSETNVTVQKRKSGRTRRSVSTPERGTPNSNTPKKSSPNEINITGTYLRSGIAPKGTTPTNCSIINTSVSLPNSPTTPYTPEQPISLALKKNFFTPKSLTKGLREVRKIENGAVGDNNTKSDDVKVLVSSPVASLPVTTPAPVAAEHLKTETKDSCPLIAVSSRSVSPTSTRSKSVDNGSTKRKKGGTQKGSSRKVSARAGGRSESEPRNILNGHTEVLQNGSAEEKGPSATEETSSVSEPVTPEKNASNKKSFSTSAVDVDSPVKRPRGRPPKRRPEVNKDSNATSPGKSSRKLATVVVDVHNTMNGEPQTVIPVSKPVLRGKRISPQKKLSHAATPVLPGASDEANTKDSLPTPKRLRNSGEIKSSVENKNTEKAPQSVLPVHESKKGKASTGKKDSESLREDREENENSSASICNQTPISPDKTHSTKLAKGVQKPTHQEVPSESEPENVTAISSSLTSTKEQKALKSSPKLKAVQTKRKESNHDIEKTVIGKGISTAGVNGAVETTEAQESKAGPKGIYTQEGKINSTQVPRSKAVQKCISAQKGKYVSKDNSEEIYDSVDVSTQKGNTLIKSSSTEKVVCAQRDDIMPTAATEEREISPLKRNTATKMKSNEKNISLQESTHLLKDVSASKDVCTQISTFTKVNSAECMLVQDDTSLKGDSLEKDASTLPKAECAEKAVLLQRSKGNSNEKDTSQKSSSVPRADFAKKEVSTKENKTLPKSDSAEKSISPQKKNAFVNVNSTEKVTSVQKSNTLSKASSADKSITANKKTTLLNANSIEKETSSQKNSAFHKGNSSEKIISVQKKGALVSANSVEKDISSEKSSTLLKANSAGKVSSQKNSTSPNTYCIEKEISSQMNTLPKANTAEKGISLQKSNTLPKANSSEKNVYTQVKNICTLKASTMLKSNSTEKNTPTKSGTLPKDNSEKNVSSEKSSTVSKLSSIELDISAQKGSTLHKANAAEKFVSTQKTSTLLKANASEKEICTKGSSNLSNVDSVVKDVSLQKSNAVSKVDFTEKPDSDYRISSLPKTNSTEKDLYTLKTSASPKPESTMEDSSTQTISTMLKASSAEKVIPEQSRSCLSKAYSTEKDIFIQKSNTVPKDNSVAKDISAHTGNTLLKPSSIGNSICTQKSSTLPRTVSVEKGTNISLKKSSTLSKTNSVEKDESALKGNSSLKVISSSKSGSYQKGNVVLKEIQTEKGKPGVKGNIVQKDTAQASDQLKCDDSIFDYSHEKQIQSSADTAVQNERLDALCRPIQRGSTALRDNVAYQDSVVEKSHPVQGNEMRVIGPSRKDVLSVKGRSDVKQSQESRPIQKGSAPEKNSIAHQDRLSHISFTEKGISLPKGSPLKKSVPGTSAVPGHKDAITVIDSPIPQKNLVRRGANLQEFSKTREFVSVTDNQQARELNQSVPVNKVIDVYDYEENIKTAQKDIVEDINTQRELMAKGTLKVGKDNGTPDDSEIMVINQVHEMGRTQKNDDQNRNNVQVSTQTLTNKGKKQVGLVPTDSGEQGSSQKHVTVKNETTVMHNTKDDDHYTQAKKDTTIMKSMKDDVETHHCTQAQMRLEKQGQASEKEVSHIHKGTNASKASEGLDTVSSSGVSEVKDIYKAAEHAKVDVSQEVETEAQTSSTATSLSEVQSSSASKSKEKVPRILKQLLQDEGVQNILKSMGEESGIAPETSPNNDPGAHKLRPKRAAEPMLSSSPELDAIEALITSSTKKKKRGTELDTLYMDEGVLNLLTSLESQSRRNHQDDAGSDISQASSSRSVRGSKSSKSSLELHSESRKRKLSGASTVSNSSTRSVQPPESKRSRLEGQEPSEDPYELDSVDELQEESAVIRRDASVADVNQAKKKGKTIPVSVKQKSKTIRIQLKPQKQKEMNSLASNSQSKEDDNMNLADLQDVLRRAKEKFNETPLQTTTIEEPGKSVPPLKIKLASDSVTIKSVSRPSPLPQPATVSVAGKTTLLSKQNVQNLSEDSRRPNSRPSSAPLETRMPIKSSEGRTLSYQGRCTPVLHFRRLDNIPSPSVSSFPSLVRTIDGSGQQKSRQRIGGESLRQSQRASVRQSESNYHYRDISLRKFNNFTQIILSPSTTKMKNALNSRVLRELCEALNLLKRDESVRMVLLTATGSTFCQGVDLTALQHPNIDTRKKNAENLVRGIKDFLKALVQFPKPIVAGVNGNAMGLGVTMLPLFDMVIANDKAEFYLPYAKLGQVPEGGATYTFPYLFGKLPSTKLFLGHKLTASKAEEMGLASESIWPATYQQQLIPKVALLATQSAQSMEATKALMNHHLVTKLELSLESECRLLLQQWTSPHFAHMCKRFLDSHHVHLQKPVNLPL